MIKEANFSKTFCDLSQMMLKHGRNIRWVEILRNLENFDDFISNPKVCRHNRHFDVVTTKEVQSLHCFFVLDELS